jgi:hypothetical protein
MECDQLAGAFERFHARESASKLVALHTLRAAVRRENFSPRNLLCGAAPPILSDPRKLCPPALVSA